MVCREYLAVPILSVLPVKIFAKVPYLQHYHDTACLDQESYVFGKSYGTRNDLYRNEQKMIDKGKNKRQFTKGRTKNGL